MGFADLFTYLGIFVFIYYLIYIILVCFCDCDLGLAYAEKYGYSIDSLRNKVIWVTGASSGIGKHLALVCAKHGSKVILSARRQDELNKVKEICIENGAKDNDILVLPMDMLNIDEHKPKFDLVLKQFGRLDILVNNAGRSQRANWESIDLAVDKQMFNLNVFSVVSLSRVVLKYFLLRGFGHLAVTSSCAGLLGVPFSGSYTGAKHAIHGYFESLRAEKMSENIDITLFCPGPTFTEFLQESFTDTVDKKYGVSVKDTDKRMTGERCGELFAIALANKTYISWACLFPISPLLYLSLYFPNLRVLILKAMGAKGLHKLRDGDKKSN